MISQIKLINYILRNELIVCSKKVKDMRDIKLSECPNKHV